MNERIDQVYNHLSDVKNEASLACAVTRMETTLSGIEQKMSSLDSINKTLAEHSHKLSELAQIDKKLDDIDDTIRKAKVYIGVSLAVISFCAGVTWWLFGSYLGKVIEALNALVLK